MDIRWGQSDALFLLWLLLPLGWLLLRARARKQRAARALLSDAMGSRLMPALAGLRSRLPAIFALLAIGLLVLAAARPRFFHRFEQVSRRGSDLVVVLDVSRSMLSEDVHPNRLERSKAYVRDLLAKLVGDRVGLVAFAGKAVPLCPLTVDHGFFDMVLEQVSPDSAPRGGTAIGDALRGALELLDPQPDRDQAIVLITDGEDQDSYPVDAARAAAARGARIFTVGIGDPSEGAKVPGPGGFLQHEGKDVVSRMDEDLLKKIALETGGAYVPVRTGTYDLGQVYVDHLSKLRTSEMQSEKRKRYLEQYQWFAACGLGLFVIAMLIDPYRSLRSGARRAAAAAMLLLALGSARADDSAAPAPAAPDAAARAAAAETFNAGLDKLAHGETEPALAAIDEAGKALGGDTRVELGRAAALQASGKLDDAKAAYEKAALGADREATVRARYNLGTLEVEQAKTALGEHPEDATGDVRKQALDHLESAVGNFRAALDVDPRGPCSEDARHNLELMRVYLKHIRDVWKRKDEEKAKQQQQQEPPIATLDKIWKQQEELRTQTRALSRAADSPQRSEQLRAQVDPQRALVETIGAAREKLLAALDQQVQQSQAQTKSSTPQQEEAIAQAKQRIESAFGVASAQAEAAAAALEGGDPSLAESGQHDVIESIVPLWLPLAAEKLDPLLKKMLEIQKPLVDSIAPRVDAAPGADADGALDAEHQSRVGAFAPILAEVAGKVLPVLEKQAQAPAQPVPEGTDPAAKAEMEKQQKAQQEQVAKTIEVLRRAIEKAPKIPPLAEPAAAALAKDDYREAQPKAEEILKILQEIAPPPDDQDKKDPQTQDQKNQDDKDKQDPKDQDQKQDPKDSKDQDQQQQDQKKPHDKTPEEKSKEQMQKLLQQARDRQKAYDEKKKALERALAVPVPVEKDW